MRGATRVLILCNVAVFVLQMVASSDWLLATFALWPVGHFWVDAVHTTVGFHAWQLVTSAFLHGNAVHLALNMFALWMFGRDVEERLGSSTYLRLYGAAVLSSAVVQLVVVSVAASTGGAPAPTVGASGGVFGVLLAFGMLFPRRMVVLLFPPIPMPAWFLVLSYAVLELINGVLGTDAGVAHFAHLGGMLGAYVVLRFDRRRGHASSSGSARFYRDAW
jgi:membrane associated rhomboid family serine protease